MLTFLLTLGLIFLSISAYGQIIIKGSVQATDGQPLAYANALLLNPNDSSLVKGAVVNASGYYTFEQVSPGYYLIAASMVGYETSYSKPFNLISATTGTHHMQLLVVATNEKQLQEITVTASKPLYEQQIDKLVINVQSSITAAGSTALEVLERSPGIGINRQENSLTMSGKEGVVVMLNGKTSRIPMATLMQMLSGMNTNTIERIELVSTPSAKYDAEGNAGVINIVLKKSSAIGTNGSYSATLGYGWYEKPGTSFNLNHRRQKLNLYGNGSFLWDHGRSEITSNRSVVNQPDVIHTATTTNRELHNINYTARLGFDYLLNEHTTISGLLNGFNNRSEQFARNQTQIHRSDQLDKRIQMTDHEVNQWRNFMANINLNHIFSNKGELNIDADYLFYHHNNPHAYKINYFFEEDTPDKQEQMHNTKSTPIQIWIGKVDYSKNVSAQTRLETGIKRTKFNLNNDVLFERFIGETWKADEEFNQNVTMQENISAAFFNVNHQFNSKTNLQTGLRWEFTSTSLNARQGANILNRNYHNLFPSVFISRELANQNKAQFSYSRRITRPTYTDLAPAFTFLDPYTYGYGNSALLATLTHALQAAYQFKKSYMLTLQYSHDKNAVSRLPVVTPQTNRQILIKANIASTNTLALVLNIPLTITYWWQIQNNLIGSWQQSKADYSGEKMAADARFTQINSIHNFKLPDNYFIELSGFYKSRALHGIWELHPSGSLNIGIQKKLNQEKGTLAFNITDVFWTSQFKVSANYPASNLDALLLFKYEPRVVRLTYSRNFGNKNVKAIKQRVTGSEEERKRVGN
ncbi:outer membrane beta-barrel protein [Adhaeribacter rhizoryzae]|uniref:Outer membrane beta-barrel protein n=1 Tax=Adhaeribacter rhizoryzae TaxID=2607907 RepID=A0A5M6DS70_9BACT|nr:outer membrane beta-barrel protein [Adhaeribacter rhizoryzae]KAA5548255.1 outer membrane beta-barrel protein [Adhaeribacter rhizoryzae]